jgi:hypothetical protein
MPRCERKMQNHVIALFHNELGQPTTQSTLNHELYITSIGGLTTSTLTLTF